VLAAGYFLPALQAESQSGFSHQLSFAGERRLEVRVAVEVLAISRAPLNGDTAYGRLCVALRQSQVLCEWCHLCWRVAILQHLRDGCGASALRNFLSCTHKVLCPRRPPRRDLHFQKMNSSIDLVDESSGSSQLHLHANSAMTDYLTTLGQFITHLLRTNNRLAIYFLNKSSLPRPFKSLKNSTLASGHLVCDIPFHPRSSLMQCSLICCDTECTHFLREFSGLFRNFQRTCEGVRLVED
jgi:hypothetical protein